MSSHPYSSFQAAPPDHVALIFKNYPHWETAQVMVRMKSELSFFEKEGIVTTELLCLIAGNYSKEAYIRLDAETDLRTTEPLDRILHTLVAYSTQLNHLARLARKRKFEGRQEELEQLTSEVSIYIQAVTMPMLLKLDRHNRDLYAPFQYDNFTASIASSRGFKQLAQQFVMHFFEFACYSDRTQRLQVLELAVRKGKELLPTLSNTLYRKDFPPNTDYQDSMSADEHCNYCFWTFLQYFDVAKSSRHKTGSELCGHLSARHSLLLRMDEEITRLFKPLGKTNMLTKTLKQDLRRGNLEWTNSYIHILVTDKEDIYFNSRISTDLLQAHPTLSYIVYAIDYLSAKDIYLKLQRARANDLLLHLSPLLSLDFECSVALVSGLHPRLGGTREVVQMVRYQEERDGTRKRTLYRRAAVSTGSPIYLLDEGIVKKIWELAAGHFEKGCVDVEKDRSNDIGKRGQRRLNRV